jgi:hypothetical protein
MGEVWRRYVHDKDPGDIDAGGSVLEPLHSLVNTSDITGTCVRFGTISTCPLSRSFPDRHGITSMINVARRPAVNGAYHLTEPELTAGSVYIGLSNIGRVYLLSGERRTE